MTRTTRVRILAAVAVLAGAAWAWHTWWPDDERAIRRRLDALAGAVNQDAGDGLAAVGRAAEIGGFFTHDVVIDPGQGSAPVQGREAVIGLAARLPAGPAGYTLEFDDVNVTVGPDAAAADVRVLALLTRRSGPARERSTEARELQLVVTKQDGEWRIARATAVDTLRRE